MSYHFADKCVAHYSAPQLWNSIFTAAQSHITPILVFAQNCWLLGLDGLLMRMMRLKQHIKVGGQETK